MCGDQPPDPVFVNHVLNNNLTDQFSLLRGAPGVCLESVTWEAIKGLVEQNTEQSLAKLGRHPSGIVTYRKYRKQVGNFLCPKLCLCLIGSQAPKLCVATVLNFSSSLPSRKR